jgi:hypothetical protein
MATNQVEIPIITGDGSANTYPASIVGTVHRHIVAAFLKDVVGSWYGLLRVPQNYVSTPNIIMSIGANATTGVTSLFVATAVPANNESYNPGSYTTETTQNITVPGTAYVRKDVTFSLSSSPAAGDDLLVRFCHSGTDASDTLAVDTLLFNAVFQYSDA